MSSTQRSSTATWQSASSRPAPKLASCAHKALAAALAKADIVISHAGTGSALAALNAGRYPILAIRDPAHGEQVDDHQHQLATELARRNLAMHRDAPSVTVDDMIETLGISVRRTATPPSFELRH